MRRAGRNQALSLDGAVVMSDHSSLIQELEHAISSGTAKKRQKALTLVTDLFMAGSGRYTDQQLALFDDVLLTLASSIETKARVKLSKRLASVSDAPIRLVRSLAFDDVIEVAAPVLKSSPRLSDEELERGGREWAISTARWSW